MYTYWFPGVHLGQVRLEPPDGPRRFALDGLVLELLVRGLHDERNVQIHDAIGSRTTKVRGDSNGPLPRGKNHNMFRPRV